MKNCSMRFAIWNLLSDSWNVRLVIWYLSCSFLFKLSQKLWTICYWLFFSRRGEARDHKQNRFGQKWGFNVLSGDPNFVEVLDCDWWRIIDLTYMKGEEILRSKYYIDLYDIQTKDLFSLNPNLQIRDEVSHLLSKGPTTW